MKTKTLHFGSVIISRNKASPDNAVAACAYRAGKNLHDEKLDITHSYSNRKGIIAAEIFAPDNSPSWMRGDKWADFANEIEKAEDKHNRRATALLGKDFQMAAPRELNDEQNWQLAKDFTKSFEDRGLAVGVAFHKSQASDGQDNPHFHFFVPMREVNEQGFGKRYRKFDGLTKGQEHETMKLRREYYACVNQSLQDAGIINIYYDPEKQSKIPKVHLGKNVAALEKKGVKTIFSEYNQRVDAENFVNQYSAPINAEWEETTEYKSNKTKRNYESLEKYRLNYQLNRGSAIAARDASQKSQSNVTSPPVKRSEKATERAREGAKLAARQNQTWQERVGNRDFNRER